MRIQHNIPAMSAYRNYTNNVSAMKKNLEKLSSGYRINRAGDDAAGLAISEKMRAQITGLQTAQKNAKDGISLVQTAEGALTEVHDMLNRMVTLAEQSANGTYDDEVDRAQLQKELDQLRSEINRIADSSNFNGIKLLDGTMATDSVQTALLGTDPSSMVDGSMPTPATKANITVKLNQPTSSGTVTLQSVTDGRTATPATPAEITFTPGAGGVPLAPSTATADTQVGGADITKHAKNEAATFTISFAAFGGTAQGAQFKIGGVTIASVASIAANAAAADVAGAVFAAMSNTTVTIGSAQFKVSLETGGKLKFTAVDKTKLAVGSGSNALLKGTTGVTFTGGNLVANSTTLGSNGVSTTAYKVKGAYDLSGWAGATDKLKIGDVSVAAGATTDLDSLAEYLEKKGIKMNRDNGDNNVTFTSIPHINGALATDDVFNLTSDAAVTDLLDATFGTTGKTVDELFYVYLGSSTTAVTATSTDVLGTASVRLVAKVPGKMTAAAEKEINALANQGATVVLGADQGMASGGGAAKYEFTFDTTKLEGGQFFSLGGKTFLFTRGTSSAVPGDAQVPAAAADTTISLDGLDREDDAQEIADMIRTALNKAFGSTAAVAADQKFTVSAAIGSGSGTTFKISMTAKASLAGNADLGNVRISEGSGSQVSGAITADYTAYTDNADGNTGKFATATWKLTPGDFKAGTTITIGSVSVKIVASNADASKFEINSSAASAAALATLFEQAGYKSGKVAFGTDGSGNITSVTITEAQYTGRTGSAFAAGEGMVTIAKANSTPLTAKTADGALNITTGTTQYTNIMNAQMGNAKVKDLFNVMVNGKAISADSSTVFQNGDVITFEAKVAGAQEESIINMFKYTEGAVVTRANGTDEGTNSVGANTHYELNFNLASIAGGQTFAIGNDKNSKTFEISLDTKPVNNGTTGNDEKINGDHVVIYLGGMDPTTLEGQKEMMKAIKDTIVSNMPDFDVTDAGDPAGSKFTLFLDAKESGPDYNYGEIRISQANGAISGIYDPASSGETGTKGKFAQVTYDIDLNKLQAGDVLTIGGTSIKIVADSEKSGGDQLTVSDAKNADKLIKAFGSNKYPADQLQIADGKLTITGTKVGQTGAELAAGEGKVGLTSLTRDLSAKTGGLTLQIGDTADSYNRLKVDIRDMHTAAMGIADISIADQESAAAAVDAIRNAINYVSDVRGTLGATQNRLDHTINNLSVMTENIQDAESTIRDVDVAEEMMAYTKNNILIQSAQAMLAQANQMPQGVLQLLQ